MSKSMLEIPVEDLAGAIMGLPLKEHEELWWLLATIEEKAHPQALTALRESEKHVSERRLHTFEEIFGKSL